MLKYDVNVLLYAFLNMNRGIYSNLTDTLLGQEFSGGNTPDEQFELAKIAALQQSRSENAISVVSNIHDNSSFIVYGRLGHALGISMEKEGEEVPSIWEDRLLERIHPDDIVEKLALELQFLTFVKSLPADERQDYYLQHVLRMKNADDDYTYLLHRIYYLQYDDSGNVMLALCLYTMLTEAQTTIGIINTLTGRAAKDTTSEISSILSDREAEVLRLIGKGKASKEIADRLNISPHTVNGHRQNIIRKMHVSNSTEAYNVAQRLGMI